MMALGNLDFNQIIVRSLAVLGGFLAGFLLTGAIVAAASKPLGIGEKQRKLKGILKSLGGFAAAIAVAMLVFGEGSAGFGGNGGKSDRGETDADGPAKPQPINTAATPSETPASAAANGTMTITILGGTEVIRDAEGLRFYKVHGQPQPLHYASLLKEIQKRKAEAPKPLVLEIYLSKNQELPQDHYAVRDLRQWALEKEKLEVRFLGTR